jgi:hypothetical protein
MAEPFDRSRIMLLRELPWLTDNILTTGRSPDVINMKVRFLVLKVDPGV